MALEPDRSGSTICSVLDQRQTLTTAVTVPGAYTTVDITRTFPSHAIPTCLLTVTYYVFRLLYYVHYLSPECYLIAVIHCK